MVCGAQLVDGVNQRAHAVGIDVRRDAVAEIEHVSGAGAVTFENTRYPLAYRLGTLP